jgi:hypothetical protein
MYKTSMVVSLDALYDTRLTCLKILNNKAVPKVLSGGYFTRSNDIFSKCNDAINDDLYEKIWAERDYTILQNSRMSNIINYIKHDSKYNTVGLIDHPESVEIDLTINLYPYQIRNSDIKALCNTLRAYLGVNKILVINLSPKELSVDYILSNFNTVVMYSEWYDWFNAHADVIPTGVLRNHAFKVPLLLRKDIDTPVNYSLEEYSRACSLGFSSMLAIELLPISDYCIHVPCNTE